MTTLQKAIVGAMFVVAVATGIYEARQAAQWREHNQQLRQQQLLLAAQIAQLQQELIDATNQLARSFAGNPGMKLNASEDELLKLRGAVSQLREKYAKPSESDSRVLLIKAWMARAEQLRQLAGQYPDKTIPELNLLSDQNWMDIARNAKFDSAQDIQQALARLREEGETTFGNDAGSALLKYMNANGGNFPQNLSDLQPYFETPMDSAILDRWEIVPWYYLPYQKVSGDWAITQKNPVDAQFDNRSAISPNMSSGMPYESPEIVTAVATIASSMAAYAADNNGGRPTNPSQILPYLTTPEQQAAFQKLQPLYFREGMALP